VSTSAASAEAHEHELPEEAYAAALASLPEAGPKRLRGWFDREPPSAAWRRLQPGREARAAQVWELHSRLGIAVLMEDHPDYPPRLFKYPQPPPVLFCLGDPATLRTAPTVAIVGTRAATRYGLGVAAQFGTELSAAGVSVVSGLALGIDGAAHEGGCAGADGAPPIAVVAGGLNTPYPGRHFRLWQRVAERGAVVSESPAGVPTERWRFPVRNRLMAALSDVVVVVESRHGGGSRYTADAALERGIPVGAVPGSIRSATSEGTNALLSDGAFPVCSVADILMALSREGAILRPRSPHPNDRPDEENEPDLGEDASLYGELSQEPSSMEDLLERTGLEMAELCAGLQRLARVGLARDLGGWWERT
jgi:DNA processing protein